MGRPSLQASVRLTGLFCCLPSLLGTILRMDSKYKVLSFSGKSCTHHPLNAQVGLCEPPGPACCDSKGSVESRPPVYIKFSPV